MPSNEAPSRAHSTGGPDGSRSKVGGATLGNTVAQLLLILWARN